MNLDIMLIAEPVVRFAMRHKVRSVLHIGVNSGFLGAALRQSLDYGPGRLNPDQWRAHITGLVLSGAAVPFGYCYDSLEVRSPKRWLDGLEGSFDLILAPRIALQLERDEAGRLLKGAYKMAASLLITVVQNDLAPRNGGNPGDLFTLQLASAAFPRVHFIDFDGLALAVIKNEFLPL